MKAKTLLITMFLLLAIGLSAGLELNLKTPDRASLENAGQIILDPGAPMLPYYALRVLVPFGESVEAVDLTLQNPRLLSRGTVPAMARTQQPTSMPAPDTTLPNPLIWNVDSPWPTESYRYLGTQFQRGYQIAVINVFPYKYNPVTRELLVYEDISLSLHASPDRDLSSRQANMLRRDANALRELAEMVVNPSEANSYAGAERFRTHVPQSRLIDLSTPKRMIVITDPTRVDWFTDYVQWREANGVSTGIFTTQDIYAQYTGIDNAAKVRAFIIDAYQSWAATSTPLEYVILGGDDEIVPERGAYGQVGDTVDTRMPVDIYFSNLDGNWDANNNQIYGEILDDTDMVPELHIGRFPAELQSEFQNMFRKIQYYVQNTTFSNNIALMFGENLNWNPVTWGGDYKDDVATHIPETYELRTLYQRDGTYNENLVWNAINDGANVMNHMGHANETFLMGQGNNTIEQLQNTEYGFLYTQGCYPAAFDQRTSGDGECIAEHMVTTAGGLFSFIGNTRYGWYMPGGINGASQFYDRQYFIGLFETLNTELGKALTYSRAQNLNAALTNDVMRWCYYEVVLFGDPSISVKYPDPSLPLLSLESYEITDEDGDGDGSFNPGESLRIYPRVRNQDGWAAAHNVSVTVTGMPYGVQLLGPCISIADLAPGALSSPDLYISFQLPYDLPYGEYNLKLSIDARHPVTQLSIGVRQSTASFAITLIDNRFPWDCENSTHSAPIVYDFNNDDDLDIMYLDVFGETYLIGTDGEQFGGFDAPSEQNVMRSSAMGDINNDGNPDLVFSSRTGTVYATTLSGTPIFNYDSGSSFLFTPVIADIDGDGTNEVLVHSLDKRLFAFRANGTQVPGFPVSLTSTFPSELAAADLDNDGACEIILGTQNGQLHVIRGNGLAQTGFPVNVGGPVTGSPLVLENNRIAIGAGPNLVLISSSGSEVFSKALSAAVPNGAVPADLTRDGSSELVFTTLDGKLYAVNQSGNDLPGFPINIGASFTAPPLIADLDGDVYLEILMQSYISSVYAFNHDGSNVPGFPFGTSFNGNTPATLTDLDGDGILRLISGYSTGILVVNLRRPVTAKMPWTVYRGGLMRQGSYAATGYVDNPNQTIPPLRDQLLQNYPNPFNPSTSISFSLSKASHASLRIYNLKGQLVRTLLDGQLSQGSHTLVWDGRDSSGTSVASGVYLYRLETPGSSFGKRMLLMK